MKVVILLCGSRDSMPNRACTYWYQFTRYQGGTLPGTIGEWRATFETFSGGMRKTVRRGIAFQAS